MEKSCRKDQRLLKNQQVLALESNKKDSKINYRKRGCLIIPLIHLLMIDKTWMCKKYHILQTL
ncbi:DUF536 domain-containing protein [Staphylococcus shinii]|nr:DUF536 domain-containing protein [Staphylococcus shinii]